MKTKVFSSERSDDSQRNTPHVRTYSSAGYWLLKACVGAAIAVVSFATGTGAQTLTPNTVPYADVGNITTPLGATWVGAAPASATPGRLWVSDNTAGICRLDDDPGKPGNHVILATSITDGLGCFPANNNGASTVGISDFQPIGDGTAGFLYVPIVAGNIGIYRLTINTISQQITKVETLASAAQLQKGSTPAGVALAADGNLYMADRKGGLIVRITNPAGPIGGQVVVTVGVQDKGGTFITGLAAHGNDLYLAAGPQFLYRQDNVNLCAGACVSTNLNVGSQSIANDKVGTFVYWDDFGCFGCTNADTGDFVDQWNATTGAADRYTPGIFDANGNVTTPLTSILALAVDPTGNLYIVDDTSGGTIPDAPRPVVSGASRVFFVPAGSAPYGTIGQSVSPPVAPPPPAGPGTALDFASTVTPRAMLWLRDQSAFGGHFWVSDAAKGICEVQPPTIDGTLGNLGPCYQPGVAGFVAGSLAVSTTRDANGLVVAVNLYVVDAHTPSSGIYRTGFNAVTATLTGLFTKLPAGSGSFSAIAMGLENSLYVGYSDKPQIDKFTTPDTAPTLVTRLGQTANGGGIRAMAFLQNSLYILEVQSGKPAAASVLLNASPSLQRGTAIPIEQLPQSGFGIKNKQSATFTVQDPLSITTDNNNFVWVGNLGGVYKYDLSKRQTTLIDTQGVSGGSPIKFTAVTAVVLDGAGRATAGDDTRPSTGGHIWLLQ